MISLLQARTIALSSVEVGPAVRTTLAQARGRFLAAQVRATRDVPACDNSAMDGFALKAKDSKGARRDRPRILRLLGSVYAGMPPPDEELKAGESYRIFTGAPMPPGADTVIRLEAARDDEQTVSLFIESAPGANVRRRGEEYPEGQPLFMPGQPIDAYVIGVLASLGLATVEVHPPPKVAILTIGDELYPPGVPLLPHQIYDSNGALLSSLCEEAGAEVVSHTRVLDRDEEIAQPLLHALPNVDMVVTTGGASVGHKDRVKAVVEALGGTLSFDGVAMKPGKPTGLARLRRIPICILPGNPGAACVAFDQIARPMLLKRQGALERRRRFKVRLDAPKKKQPALTYLLSARLDSRADGLWAKVRPQGAGQIFHNVGSEGWLRLPAGRGEFSTGDVVDLELFANPSYRPAEDRQLDESTR